MSFDCQISAEIEEIQFNKLDDWVVINITEHLFKTKKVIIKHYCASNLRLQILATKGN